MDFPPWVPPTSRRDRWRSAVAADGGALERAEPDLQDDWAIVAAAVTQDPSALRFASEGLRADRELRLIAVRRDPAVLGLLDLRDCPADLEIAEAAHARDP